MSLFLVLSKAASADEPAERQEAVANAGDTFVPLSTGRTHICSDHKCPRPWCKLHWAVSCCPNLPCVWMEERHSWAARWALQCHSGEQSVLHSTLHLMVVSHVLLPWLSSAHLSERHPWFCGKKERLLRRVQPQLEGNWKYFPNCFIYCHPF